MEGLGNTLKKAREYKKESLEDVSRKTNIAVRYLKALEEEDFSLFMGEVYAIGFLKSYGMYLGINPDELLPLYRAVKLQEQPTPVDQLIDVRRKFPIKIVLHILVALAISVAIAGGVYFVLHLPKRAPEESKSRKTKEYIMEENPTDRRLSLGDSFIVPYNDSNYQFMLMNIGEYVNITSPIGDLRLDLGQEVRVDMDNDGYNELKIVAADFVKNHPNTGARMYFELDDSSPSAMAASPETAEFASGTGNNQAIPVIVMFSSPTPYPFTLQVTFQGYCLFRWEILAELNRQGRNEQYFERGNELNIQAQNGVRIGASNAATVKIQVIGGGNTVPIDLGSAGEVVVADIRWIKDEDNRYRLVLAPLE
ncbi:MAG: helix-turn-helix domain-containing protein [Treponema sp.]|jgi:cytoskeletal protein RodZ|nr:helix-turn-helix domain-containing protein [Treponema sp.]